MSTNAVRSEEIRKKIRAFILRPFPGWELDDDENILDAGLLHSLTIMRLLVYIEREFEIETEGDELERGSLVSINSIVSMIENKLSK